MWKPLQLWRPIKTYVLLKAGQNAEILQAKMQSLIKQYMGDEVAAKKHLSSTAPSPRVLVWQIRF